MVDFLVECNLRVNRPGLLNSMMVGTTAKYEEDIKTMVQLADDSGCHTIAQMWRLKLKPMHSLVIANRKKNPVEKKDLLNIMLYQKDAKTGESLTDEAIRNNVRSIMLHIM